MNSACANKTTTVVKPGIIHVAVLLGKTIKEWCDYFKFKT